MDGGRQRCNSDLEGSAATGLRWQRHGADVLRSSRTEGLGLTRGTKPRSGREHVKDKTGTRRAVAGRRLKGATGS